MIALLRHTRHPDIRRFRTHRSPDWPILTVALGLCAVGLGIWLRPLASVPLAGLAGFTAYLWSLRTIVDRRRRAFAVRAPFSPWALEATHLIEQLSTQRHVKTSRGTRTVTYQVVAGDRIVADGMGEPEAHELARQLIEFLARDQTAR